MAQSHVVSVLLQKRFELMGLITVKRKELNGLVATLDGLDTTCKLFGERCLLRTLSPNVPIRKIAYSGMGLTNRF